MEDKVFISLDKFDEMRRKIVEFEEFLSCISTKEFDREDRRVVYVDMDILGQLLSERYESKSYGKVAKRYNKIQVRYVGDADE